MRADFPANAKEELAKRVGYVCSNPACRQPTSGPQATPRGTVNIGVAAHIAAASARGPRYDVTLSAEQRSNPENGLWLCQTCAKLVDSDVIRYSVEKLKEWKSDAEVAAARALENRRMPATASQGIFLEAERLMPALISEMREDVQCDRTELIREFVILPSPAVVFVHEKPQFRYYEDTHAHIRLQVDWLEEMGLVVNIARGSMPMYLLVPEFVNLLRMVT